MNDVFTLFSQRFWAARWLYGQYWLMLLLAGLAGGVGALLGWLAMRNITAVTLFAAIFATVAATFVVGAMFATGRTAMLNLPGDGIWQEGLRNWGPVWGIILTLLVWYMLVLVASGIVAIPFVFVALSHVHAPVTGGAAFATAFQGAGLLWVLIPVAVVCLLATPFPLALLGAMFMGGFDALHAIGPAFRAGYSRPGFWRYIAVDLLLGILAAAVQAFLHVFPAAGVLLGLFVFEPLLIWINIVLIFAVWRTLPYGLG